MASPAWIKSVALSPERVEFGPLLFAGNLIKGIEQASQFGYDAVELSLRNIAELDMDKIKRALRKENLDVTGIATGQTYYKDNLSLTSSDCRDRHAAINRLKSHIKLAAELDAQVIIGGIRGSFESLTWHETPPNNLYDMVLEGLNEILGVASSYDVTVTLEPINRYETNFINTTEEALDLIERCSGDNFKLLLDSFHMNIEEASYRDAIYEAGEHLSYIHFADNHRLAPGSGHLKFANIFDALEEIEFRGPISAEVLPRPDDYSAMEKTFEFFSKEWGYG